MDCWSLVEDTEAQPVKTKHQDENDYEGLRSIQGPLLMGLDLFLETVDPQWLPIITAAQTPSRIWKALQGKFAHETTTSFHSQFAALLNLGVKSKSDLSATISKFDTEWIRLNTRCSVAKADDTFKLPLPLNPFPNP